MLKNTLHNKTALPRSAHLIPKTYVRKRDLSCFVFIDILLKKIMDDGDA